MNVNLIATISLDGYIAHNSQDKLMWSPKEDKHLFTEVTKKAGVVIMGNTTFNNIGHPLTERLNVIVTRTPQEHSSIPGHLEYTDLEPQAILTSLQKRHYTEVFIAGGADIYQLFLTKNLIDELWLTINPHIFGSGISLFADTQASLNLQLIESRLLTPSHLFVRYSVTK